MRDVLTINCPDGLHILTMVYRNTQFFCHASVLKAIDHFTVVCFVTWPLNGSEAGGGLVLIQTSQMLCKSSSYANLLAFKQRSVLKQGHPQPPLHSWPGNEHTTAHTTVKWPIVLSPQCELVVSDYPLPYSKDITKYLEIHFMVKLFNRFVHQQSIVNEVF